jgi:hypothetical protein
MSDDKQCSMWGCVIFLIVLAVVLYFIISTGNNEIIGASLGAMGGFGLLIGCALCFSCKPNTSDATKLVEEETPV